MTPTVVVSARAEERWRHGHPWIYRGDVREVRASAGDVVRVLGPRGRKVGWAFFSDQSQIALRMLTQDDEPVNTAFLMERLEEAIAFRRALGIDATAYRLVHAEADRLPSVIVDRYGDWLVVQALSQASDRLMPEICRSLGELLNPRGILARNDAKVRLLEGLDRRVEVLAGEVPDSVVVREGALELEADLRAGQKTGLFLDQRENRLAARSYARGRVLDGFSYDGGFALQLAPSCRSVLAIDSADLALARACRNAERNRIANLQVRSANVFDALHDLERAGERFDTVVLDPPAFARNKSAVPRALAGYKDINLRALRLLVPGGYLITCSCSYNVDEATFAETILEAAIDARVGVTVVEKRMQGRDHPVLLGVPETYYLKCFILRRVR